MSAQGTSNFVKNGQQLKVPAGSSAVAQGDLVLVGGLGSEAWPVATIDYAVNAEAQTLLSPSAVASFAVTGSARQAVARDRLGNVYIMGTNGSGRLVAYKRSPLGASLVSAVLDSTATTVNTPILFQLSNGNFCCVYARSAGVLCFVIFDSMLTLIAGPSAFATERASTNVVYHSAVALSGGGFAVVFQSSAATAINLVTYSNAGSPVLGATSVQALTGSAAVETLKLGQLSSGNLVCAYRGTMAANSFGGTSFTVFTVGGVNVAGPTSVDSTSVAGLLEISVMTGYFAVAEANGTNLICAVYTNAGVVQGTPFSAANTLNAGTYPQVKLTNDGIYFWLAYFSSAGNGLYLLGLTAAGATYASASGMGSSTLSASTFALDAEVINGSLVALAASSGTSGQYWLSAGLPDASLGVSAPYLRSAPTAIGSAAATTGSLWPRLLSGGGGLYRGSSPPVNQPTAPATCGDFTAIMVYDQQNSATTLMAIVKVETTAVLGVSMAEIAAGQAGVPFFVNPGQGEYPTSATGGTAGQSFNHLDNALAGTAGVVYANGVALTGISNNTPPANGNLATDLVGYLDGLNLSTAGGSAVFGIAAGVAADTDSTVIMQLVAAYTKTTDAWAAGSGNGSLDQGSIANSTWYAAYLIRNPSTRAVDVITSLNFVVPALLPTDYTQYRRIGAMQTDGSGHWVAFQQFGDDFYRLEILDLTGGGGTQPATLTALSVPVGIVVEPFTVITANSINNNTAAVQYAPGASATLLATVMSHYEGNPAQGSSSTNSVIGPPTDTSARIYVGFPSYSGEPLYIHTCGWRDLRGRS